MPGLAKSFRRYPLVIQAAGFQPDNPLPLGFLCFQLPPYFGLTHFLAPADGLFMDRDHAFSVLHLTDNEDLQLLCFQFSHHNEFLCQTARVAWGHRI